MARGAVSTDNRTAACMAVLRGRFDGGLLGGLTTPTVVSLEGRSVAAIAVTRASRWVAMTAATKALQMVDALVNGPVDGKAVSDTGGAALDAAVGATVHTPERKAVGRAVGTTD